MQLRHCRLRNEICSDSLRPMAKSALGKGLGALIGTPARRRRSTPQIGAVRPGREGAAGADLDDIVASPLQPRNEFAPEALQELVDSIRQHGIIQPLIVRMVNGKHELIAGERRWRAAQRSRPDRRRR